MKYPWQSIRNMLAMFSYMILAPNEMKAEPDERKSAGICLNAVNLDPELYRLGHTKARIIHSLTTQQQRQPRATTATDVKWQQSRKGHTAIVLAPSTSLIYSPI